MYVNVNGAHTMSLDNYNRIKVIGSGSYGEVWLSKHKTDRKQVLFATFCMYFAVCNWLDSSYWSRKLNLYGKLHLEFVCGWL